MSNNNPSLYRYILNEDGTPSGNPVEITVKNQNEKIVSFFDTKFPEFDDDMMRTYVTHLGDNKYKVSDSRNLGDGSIIEIVDEGEKKLREKKKKVEKKHSRRDEALGFGGIGGRKSKRKSTKKKRRRKSTKKKRRRKRKRTKKKRRRRRR